jgi:tetratricopeptide (TPR) repeat protein
MRMKPLAVTVASLVLVLRFLVGNYDQADAKLDTFYAQILSTDFSGAQKTIDEAINLWPSNARYYGWRAYVVSQRLPPQCTHGSQGAGATLKTEDQSAIRLAVADYRKALELNGRDAVAHHNLGWLEHLTGDDASAARDWAEAVRIDPGNAVFHLSYGMFLEELKDTVKAKEQYQTAIELSPSIVDSQFFTRYRIRDKGGADSVIEAVTSKLEEKLGQGKDPILEARLGKLYLFQSNLLNASQMLEDAAEQLPNLPLVWMNLGEVLEKQGNLAEAMDCYRKANVVNGSLAGPYLRIGEIELRNGQKSEAAGNFSEAVQRWQRVNPITAAHNNRLYVGPRQRIDDLLPTTLVWYTTPCEASRAWMGLSQLYPARRHYLQMVHVCEDLPSPHVNYYPG